MDLKQWLKKNRWTVTAFAAQLDYNRSYISGIVNGHYVAPKRLAKAIEKETGGEISAGSIMRLKKTKKTQ